MGKYTSIVDSQVQIIDKEGLEIFLDKIKKGEYDEYREYSYLLDGVRIDGDELDFSGMDNWKIISYWYPEFVMFLRDLAVFVEGEVYLEFENSDEGGHIQFKGGECIITTGVMTWTKWKADEISKIPKMRDEVKDRLFLRNL